MPPITKTVLLALLIASGVTFCKNPKANKVKISFQVTGFNSPDIKIITPNMVTLNDSILAVEVLDSTGVATLELEIPTAKYGLIKIDDNMFWVYLKPGSNLKVSLNKEKAEEMVTYSGEGSEVSTYLYQILKRRQQLETAGGKLVFSLNRDEFLHRLDSMKTSLSYFHQTFVDNNDIRQDLSESLKRSIDIYLLRIKLNYTLMLLGNDQYLEKPEDFQNTMNEVPLDPTLLNTGMLDYRILLHFYLDLKHFNPNRSESNPDNYIRKVRESIVNNKYPSGIEEFLMSLSIYSMIGEFGIISQIEDAYADFRKEYKNSLYLPSIDKLYNKWLAISKGAVAPEITGLNLDGQPASLSNFKGKVVYIDVWATWCRPCIEEIPYSNNIQKYFEGNNDVVFLNISIDDNLESWKRMLTSDKKFMGEHVIEQVSNYELSIMNKYLISGIPRYILIDQQGKIANPNADKPSSGKIEKEILKLL